MSKNKAPAFGRSSGDAGYLYGGSAPFLEDLYSRFLEDPNAVGDAWREAFQQFGSNGAAAPKRPSWARDDWPVVENGEWTGLLDSPELGTERIRQQIKSGTPGLSDEEVRAAVLDSIRAIMMIRAYRVRGHLEADLDPLRLEPTVPHPELDYRTYEFTEADLDRPILIDNMLGLERASLREMLEILRRTYCATIGVEFMHIMDPAEKSWIQERSEGPDQCVSFAP